MISGYFIGYLEKSKGYRFYCPNHSPRIVETDNEKFIENGEVSGSGERQNVEIKETRMDISLPINVPSSILTPNVVLVVEEHFNNIEQHLNEQTLHEEPNSQPFDLNESQEITLRRSQRERRSAIYDDYVIYL